MLKISDLIISQESLRESITEMIDHVNGYGFWFQYIIDEFENKPANLISISRFPDGKMMIHDGHHRIVATYLSTVRDFLVPSEYKVVERKYEDYRDINFSDGWVTPFDPLTEIRLSSFADFKREALELSNVDVAKAEEFIRNNRHRYSKAREMSTVCELAGSIRNESEKEGC